VAKTAVSRLRKADMAVFINLKTEHATKWSLAYFALQDANSDFILSRKGMQCTPTTLDFYMHTAGIFPICLEGQGVTSPEEVTARYVRQYLAELSDKGRADNTVRHHARAIRMLVFFWHEEGYIPEPVKFAMPKVDKKRLPVLSADEWEQR